MGPTTVVLLKFFRADQTYREAKGRLDAATRDVRTQEARVGQLKAEHAASHAKATSLEAKRKELELEVKVHDERIEKLRDLQQNATDDKAYRALIVDINNHKADKTRLEEQGLAVMEQAEQTRKGEADLKARLDNESGKLKAMRDTVDDKVRALTAELEAAKGPRDAAQAELTPQALAAYTRAGERYDGESMAALERPDAREIEYLCSGCNTYLVANIYNRLMSSKDEIVHCPSCGRILYVPEELTPDLALAKKGAAVKTKAAKAPKAPKEPKVPGEKKPRAKKAKTVKVDDPNSIAGAIAAGAGAAGGRGVAATMPSAPSAPPETRADGSVVVHEDEPAETTEETPANG